MSEHRNPVTVAVSRCIRPGHEDDFTAWAQRIGQAAERFPGHLGAGHIRPADPTGEHTIIYRFDSQEHFDAWQHSAERARLVEESREIIEGEPRIETATGLEYWFADSGRPGGTAPPVWKQALLTWLGLYPTVLAVAYTVGLLVAPWAIPLRSLLTSGLSVALMTWVVMPVVTRAFRGWLRPSAA